MKSTHLWLLLTAAYRLVNENAKWQMNSDGCFLSLGLIPFRRIPQLLYEHANGELLLVVGKIVGDILAAGDNDNAKSVLGEFNMAFKRPVLYVSLVST